MTYCGEIQIFPKSEFHHISLKEDQIRLKEAQKLGFNFAIAPSLIKIKNGPKIKIIRYPNLNTFASAQMQYKDTKVKEK